MKRYFYLIKKEFLLIFRSKIAIAYFLMGFAIISYSFYSAVDLYSKASKGALNNPVYAAGFYPVKGVFVPTFSGIFMLLTIVSPFFFIMPIIYEKKENSIFLLYQFPFSLFQIYLAKFLAAILFFLFSLLLFVLPSVFCWIYFGGKIVLYEISWLILGYFLYGVLAIAVAFFSASVFNIQTSASILALSIMLFSWFVDFGKDMYISDFLLLIDKWSLTNLIKVFEEGILDVGILLDFLIFILFFFALGYLGFRADLSLKKKLFLSLFLSFVFVLSLYFTDFVNVRRDITASRRNSFPENRELFLKKLPNDIKIKIFLAPNDSRYKDFRYKVIRKLRILRPDIKIELAKGEELKRNYGKFRYCIREKCLDAFSNSKNEFFYILEKLSGIKIPDKDKNSFYKGYPLYLGNKGYGKIIFFIYLVVLPALVIFFIYKREVLRWAK